MNILILGYGKMGKAIEELAVDRGHVVKHKININNTNALKFIDASEVDVAIEFSEPSAAFENVKYCIEKGIPVVCGTTGWLDKKPEIETLCQEKGGGFFYASNFSLGVNIFFHINKILANIMSKHSGYRATITETHHTEKKDAPSGTAITLAEDLIKALEPVKSWVNEYTEVENLLPIVSLRKEHVPGTHVVRYTSDIDDIEIKHIAHSRTGFALGAIMVAEWLSDKKGIFGMNDFLKF